MGIGDKIQEVMDWGGKSQTELADLSGVSQSAISDYIRGEREPSIDALRKIAAVFDVSIWVFLNGDSLPVTSLDLTEAEREHMRQYRMLTEGERGAVDNTIDQFNKKK